MKSIRRTKAIVNVDSLYHNVLEFKKTCNPKTLIAGVLKANAYGHDLLQMATYFKDLKVDYFAVATLEEALFLRTHFESMPILVMGYTPDDDLEFSVINSITTTIFSIEQAKILNSFAKKHNIISKIHIKIDTGFHRLGYTDLNKAFFEILQINLFSNINIEGIFSHLALENKESDKIQYEKFISLINMLSLKQIDIPIKHICDSIGAVVYPEYHLDMVRVGALFYGYCSRETAFELKPVMSLQTEISSVKELNKGEGVSYDNLFRAPCNMKIATLPIGYADGLPRNIYKKGFALVNNIKSPYIGLPCMDQCMIDISDSNAKQGDTAILFGETLSLNELSKWCETNKNELLSRISMRVPRVFVKNNKIVKIVDYLNKGDSYEI